MNNKKNNQIIVIGIIGGLTLIIAGLIDFYIQKNSLNTNNWLYEFLYEAIFNIAFVLVGVFIADIVWSLVGGDPNDQFRETLLSANSLLADSIKTGIVGIFSSSSDMGSSRDWLNAISGAKETVYIQGYTLLVWTRSSNLSRTLLNLAKNGVEIRFMFMDENALYLNAGINDTYISELSSEVVKREINAMTNYLDDVIFQYNQMEGEKKGTISYVKVKNNLISSQIVISDDVAYITPYMSFFNTSHCPLYKIENRNSELYEKYLEEFKRMWSIEKV